MHVIFELKGRSKFDRQDDDVRRAGLAVIALAAQVFEPLQPVEARAQRSLGELRPSGDVAPQGVNTGKAVPGQVAQHTEHTHVRADQVWVVE